MIKKPALLLGLIILLASLLRLTNLGRLPNGFIPEEVSTGWNAYSLLNTGRDEWGTWLPIVFRETGGFKLALNSYLVVVMMAIFGPTEFAVRFPVAAAGILAVLAIYLLSKEFFKKESIAQSAAFLLAISAWHIAMSRYAVDVSLGIPLFLFGLYFFLKGKRRPKYLIGSGILFALTYYTYFNYVVFTVLFLGGLVWQNRRLLISITVRKYALLFVVIQMLAILPYILTPTLLIRFHQATSIDQIGFINRINEHRGACQTTYPQLVCRVFYNKYIGRSYEFLRNLTNHYSTTTLFLYGSNLGLSGMPNRWGFLYIFEFPLLLGGVILLIKQRKFFRELILWSLLFGVPGSLASEGHIWRMLTLLPLPQIVEGVALAFLLRTQRSRIIKLGYSLVIIVLVLRFWIDYTSYFPYAQAANSYYGFRDVYTYVAPLENKYDYIVMAPTQLAFEQLYIYYVFYRRIDPRAYQLGQDVERSVGEQNWVTVSRVGKWHFSQDVRSLTTTLPDRFLVIVDGNYKDTEQLKIPNGKKLYPHLIKKILYPNNDVAFKIIEYNLNVSE